MSGPVIKKYYKGLEVIQSPRYIIFGPDALYETSKVLNMLDMRGKALIISGPSFTRKIAEKLLDHLSREGFEVFHLVTERGDVNDVESAINKAREVKADFLIGVGGGKPLDVTKLTSAVLEKRYVTVPTSAGHDGIASPSTGFILGREFREKFDINVRSQSPTGVIADTKIISEAPEITFKSGFGDLVAKLTAVRDWELAHKLKDEPYSEYAASMALLSAKIALDHASEIKPGLEESTRILVKALIGSGVAISIAGSSRPASGSEHMFSHALDLLAKEEGFTPAPHGIQCALGTIMMAYIQGQNWKEIREKLVEAGVPVTAKEAGLKSEHVIKALTMAHKIRNRYTILGETGLTENAARKVAKITGVIE